MRNNKLFAAIAAIALACGITITGCNKSSDDITPNNNNPSQETPGGEDKPDKPTEATGPEVSKPSGAAFESANEAVKKMGLGWNLGNTLDAHAQKTTDVKNDNYWGQQTTESETCWGQSITKPELFDMMGKAGFGAIRVPVTWYNHMDKDGNIDKAWMSRVHTVVDYVINSGLYCILNVHHDTGADHDNTKSWIKADMDNYNTNKARFEKLWKQIAEEFADYDEKLLFEGYNEMLDIKNSWCYASKNYTSGYNSTAAASAYEGINSYAQSFVNIVRASGGNNDVRNLIVNTYAAACGTGNWSSHLIEPLSKMALPKDYKEGHLIFEIHTYPAIADDNGDRSIQEIKSEVDELISKLNTHLVSKGAPVIIGEWGTSNVDGGAGKTDYDVRRELMMQFAEYFVSQTKENNMATFYWMGMSDGICRGVPAFNQPDLAECVAKAYHGSAFEGKYPEFKGQKEYEAFSGSKTIGWGDPVNISAQLFAAMESQAIVEVSYTQDTDDADLQLNYGDWSSKPSFVVEGKTINADLKPGTIYGTKAGSSHVSEISFDAKTFDEMKTRGLLFQGEGITITKVVVKIVE